MSVPICFFCRKPMQSMHQPGLCNARLRVLAASDQAVAASAGIVGAPTGRIIRGTRSSHAE